VVQLNGSVVDQVPRITRRVPKCYVRFEVFSAVTMKNVFWDIKSSSNFIGDTLRLHYRVQPVNAM
jgi:hypothetical protein